MGDILPLQVVCQLLQTQQIMLNKASTFNFYLKMFSIICRYKLYKGFQMSLSWFHGEWLKFNKEKSNAVFYCQIYPHNDCKILFMFFRSWQIHSLGEQEVMKSISEIYT